MQQIAASGCAYGVYGSFVIVMITPLSPLFRGVPTKWAGGCIDKHTLPFCR